MSFPCLQTAFKVRSKSVNRIQSSVSGRASPHSPLCKHGPQTSVTEFNPVLLQPLIHQTPPSRPLPHTAPSTQGCPQVLPLPESSSAPSHSSPLRESGPILFHLDLSLRHSLPPLHNTEQGLSLEVHWVIICTPSANPIRTETWAGL